MKIVWYTNNKGKVYVDNRWVGNVYKDTEGNITYK